MPNIKTYDTPALDIRPTEVGVEATAAVGRRAGQFFNQMGQALGGGVRDVGDAYVQYEDHRQISAGAKAASELLAQKEQEWNSLLKSPDFDPNDPSTAAKFREESLEPALDKFKEGFSTQKSQQFAEHFTDQFRNHMVNKTMADVSRAAGDAVKTNRIQTVNNLASAVYRDPSSLDFALKTLDSTMDATVSTSVNLSAADASRVRMEHGQKEKEAVVKTAILGMIEKNPNINLDEVQKKYGQYINGPEMRQFQKAAQQFAQNGEEESRRVRADREHRERLDFNDKINRLEADTNPKNVGDAPRLPNDYWKRMDGLLIHPGAQLEPGRYQNARNLGVAITTQMNKEDAPAHISRETMIDVFNEIRRGRKDPDEITRMVDDAYGDGRLTWQHRAQLTNELEQRKTPLGNDRKVSLENFGSRIDGMMTGNSHSALGKQQMAAAYDDLREREQMLLKEGVSPRELYRRDSQHYFDKDGAFTNKYAVNLQQALSYQFAIGTKPGEKAKGSSKESPIVPPPEVNTAAKVRALNLPPGTWVHPSNSKAPFQVN